MGTKLSRNHPLQCQECGTDFKGLRPTDRFCCSACRYRNKDKDPSVIDYKREANRKWRSWNFNYRRDYMLRYTYGITQEKYEELLAAQDGGCAICGKTSEEEGRNLAVDHDHKTGEIFGILCAMCNKILIGRIRESSAFLRAAEYLKKGTGLFVPEKPPKKRKKTIART